MVRVVVVSDVIIKLMNHISSFDGELVEIWMHLLHQVRIELVKSILGLNDHNSTNAQHDVEVNWKKEDGLVRIAGVPY